MTKKFYLALICVASMIMFVACKNGDVVKGKTIDNIDASTLDDKTEKCWEITASKGEVSETTYEWGTEQEIVMWLQEEQAIAGGLVTFSYKANSAKTEEACEEKNFDYESEACWELTMKMGGTTVTYYMWATEELIKQFIERYHTQGYEVTYKKTDVKTEDSCEGMAEPTINGNTIDNIDMSTLDNTTEKCWEITSSIANTSATAFMWGTEYEIVLILKEAQSYVSADMAYSYKENTAKTEDACEAQNPNYEGQKACWEVTMYMGGTTMTTYMWDTESAIAQYITMYTTYGWNVTYKITDEPNEDSCEARNE